MRNDRDVDVWVVEEAKLNRDDEHRVLATEVRVSATSTRRVLENAVGAGSFVRILDQDCLLVARVALTDAGDTLITVGQAVDVSLSRPENAAAIPDAVRAHKCLTTEYPIVTDFP